MWKRKIKFRAWDSEEKIMHEWCSNFFSDCSPVTDYSGEFDQIPDTMILMQYTGVDDDFGKEIYEGDIVRHKCYTGFGENANGDETEIFETYIGIIEYTDEACFYPVCDYYFENGDIIEVIGNIYQNPEL